MNMQGPALRSSGLVVVVGAAMLLAACGGGQEQQGSAPGPAAVHVETVRTQPFAPAAEFPGRIEPVRVAEVRARVPGIVLSRNFAEGADVKAGEVLFRIDPAPYRAALARAEASLFEARATVQRYEPLVAIEAVSRQDFETAQAAYKVAAANAETARLELGYATVTAPMSGRIGRALVTEGALVGQGEATPLAIIQQLDPVYADFKQPVSEVARLRQASGGGEASISITVEGTGEKREGRLLFSDITVDRGTGQVSLRGEFDNTDGLLLPGMYVRVHLQQNGQGEAILVPQRAVRPTGQGEGQVLVIAAGAEGADVAEARQVRTGAMQGGTWHILEGLKAGERIIIDGTANPGDPVSIVDPQAAPAGDPAASAETPQG